MRMVKLKDVKVPKLLLTGFVVSYPNIALTIFHMYAVTMFLLLNRLLVISYNSHFVPNFYHIIS